MTDVDILDVECLGILDIDCAAGWLFEVEELECFDVVDVHCVDKTLMQVEDVGRYGYTEYYSMCIL